MENFTESIGLDIGLTCFVVDIGLTCFVDLEFLGFLLFHLLLQQNKKVFLQFD